MSIRPRLHDGRTEAVLEVCHGVAHQLGQAIVETIGWVVRTRSGLIIVARVAAPQPAHLLRRFVAL
jgi:hypothetical protein